MRHSTAVSAKICIHPNFVALQRTLADFNKAGLENYQTMQDAKRFFGTHADPEKWVPLIAEALGKPQLEALRTRHEQTCLAHLSYVLSAEEAQRQALDVHEQLISDLTLLLSRATESDLVEDLGDLHAIDLSTIDLCPDERLGNVPMDFESRRLSCEVLKRAFDKLVREVFELADLSSYPENSVSTAKQSEQDLLNGDDGVRLFPVRFSACDRSAHAMRIRLLAVLDEVQSSLQLAQHQVLTFKTECRRTQNGEHAHSMLQLLHGRTDICGRPPAVVLASQQEQILQREVARRLALLTLSSVASAHAALLSILKEAIIEAQGVASQMVSQSGVMTDPAWRVVSIMMINCLAADRRLRDFGPEFRRLSAICETDRPSAYEMAGLTQLLQSLNERMAMVRTRCPKISASPGV
jgi:hypothetical protein